jgi:hypothetical protein
LREDQANLASAYDADSKSLSSPKRSTVNEILPSGSVYFAALVSRLQTTLFQPPGIYVKPDGFWGACETELMPFPSIRGAEDRAARIEMVFAHF